jgi:cellulose synthase/poly-beta-1,6-N-acetylglucosamine synthase-like glycosyltransferase
MNVFVVTDLENRMATKGGILESFFHQYDQVLRSHEIICIIDADTLVSKDFLRIINREFLLGHSVFQGKIEVINGKDSCASGFLSIIQSYMNICFYKYFSNYQKKSVLLAGKGMCISTSILRKLTYKSNTLIEDVELSFELLLQNYQIHYVPDMLIMTYQPEKLNELYYQQRRWLSGQFSIIKKYQQKTILSKLDTISCAKYYIAISYIGILFPICLFNLYTLMNLHYFLSFFYLASLTITVYLALLDKNCRINSFSLLLFPIFVLGLSMINCSCLIFPQKQWHPITRSFIKNRFLLLLRAKKKLNK